MSKCPVSLCKFFTRSNEKLQQHMTLHQNTRYKYYKCSLCDYTSPKKHNVQRHMSTMRHYDVISGGSVHANPCLEPQAYSHRPSQNHKIIFEEKFQCSFCHYRSTRKLNVIKHQNLTHSAEEDAREQKEIESLSSPEPKSPPQQNEMPQSSPEPNPNPDQKETSVSKPNPEPDPHEEILVITNYQCSRCEYGSPKKQNVKRHIALKHKDVGVVLTGPRPDTSLALLNPNWHLHADPGTQPDPEPEDKIVFEEQFQCSVCEYRSINKDDVIRHQTLKHDNIDDVANETEMMETPNKNSEIKLLADFQCSECNYGSYKKQNVVRHIGVTHFDDGNVVTRPRERKAISHYPEVKFFARFQCNMCSYSSNKRHNFKRHQAAIHGHIRNVTGQHSDSKPCHLTEREKDEDEPAKRLLLAECGLIWNSDISSQTQEGSSRDSDTSMITS